MLEYWKDKTGVIIKGGIAKTAKGREVAELVRAGIVTKLSFMFGKAKYEDDKDEDSNIRYLIGFKLYEIGLVSIPANMAAVVLAAKQHNIEIKHLTFKEGKRNMSLTDEQKALMKDVEKSLKPMQTEIESIGDNYTKLNDDTEKMGKLLKQVDEKQRELADGRINEKEFTDFGEKISGDILAIQKEVKKALAASRIVGERMPMLDWKSLAKDVAFVYDDFGRPLSESHQRAYQIMQLPVDYSTAEGQVLKNIRDLNDVVIFSHQYFKKASKGDYHISKLKSFQQLQGMIEAYDPDFAKAMSTSGTGVGAEWIPTEMSAQLHEAYELEFNLASHIQRWEMPSNSAQWPFATSRPRAYRAAQAITNNPDRLKQSDRGTNKVTFTAETFAIAVSTSQEFMEDSIINVATDLRTQIALGLVESEESRYLNADDTTPGTHMDTAALWATDQSFPESYEKGFRKLAIAASNTHNVQSATGGEGDGTSAFVAEDVRYLRALLPSGSGHRAKNLVYVTSLQVWLKMLSFAQYSQPGTYGAGASWLTGDLPSFDGSPLVVSSEMLDTLETTGLYTGSATLGGLILFDKTDFRVGFKRGVTIEFDKDIMTQQLSFVGSMRSSFKSMSASGNEACAYAINIAT